ARVRALFDAALLDAQLTIHHLHETAADRQAYDREGIAWHVELCLRTHVIAETAAQDPCRHASTGVVNAEMKLDEIAARVAAQLDADAAARRPLDPAMEQSE